MDIKLLELLVCPVTKGPLNFDREHQELLSRSARLAYPVRQGIPILLENEARTLSDEEIDKLAALRPPLWRPHERKPNSVTLHSGDPGSHGF
jgi:uncharacterized protein YbaR (Trm112 family)